MINNKFKYCLFFVATVFLAACTDSEQPGVERGVFGSPKLDRTDTLGGVDADNNGVRDDIDEIINARWPHEIQRQAARQLARVFQAALLVDKSNGIEVKKVDALMGKALNCANYINKNTEYKISYVSASDEVKSLTLNTKKRLLEYDNYGRALHGAVLPGFSGDTCAYR